MPLKIKYMAKIRSIEEKFEKVYVSGVGPENQPGGAVFKNVSRGWWVHFEGSYESICVGDEKPNAAVGALIPVEMTFP